MNADEMSDLLTFLRKQVDLVPRDATAEGMAVQAERIMRGLRPEERDMAATFFVIRLLKDQHRQKVANIERASSKRRKGSFESTIPADDPYWEQKAETERRCWDSVRNALDTFAADLRVEWTRELLSSTFALPDGSFVTWGDATVEQHEARRDMLLGNATGNIQAAARHEQAIKDCLSAGATSLAQVNHVAA